MKRNPASSVRGLVRFTALTVLAAWAIPFSLAAEEGVLAGSALTPIETLPAAKWKVEAAEGDKVVLAEKDGCLGIDYTVVVPEPKSKQGATFADTSFRILLKSPIPLSANAGRITYEARGMRCDDLVFREGTETAMLYPLIQDESGEIFCYMPVDYPHFKAGTFAWGKRMTRYLYASEAGGAATQTYEAKGGNANSWPDGKLSFLGFEVKVRKKPGKSEGALELGEVAEGGMTLPYETPWAYADAFTQKSGDYTLGVAVRNQFQGMPVAEYSTKINYDSGKPGSTKQKIQFPLGPNDNYWIDWQVRDADGRQLAGESQVRYELVGNPEKKRTLAPVAADQRPSAGCLRINPVAHTDGVYQRNEPLEVVARVFTQGGRELTLAWRLREYAFDVTVAEGKEKVVSGSAPFKDVMLKAPWKDGVDAYLLLLSVWDGDTKLEEQEYIVGRTTETGIPYGERVGIIPDRNEIKRKPYLHVTYSPSKKAGFHSTFATQEDALADFVKFADEASGISRNLTYCMALEKFSILPGVYDFSLLDRLIDAAADRGCTLTFRMSPESVPSRDRGLTYVKFERQRNYDGTPNIQYYYGGGVALADAGIFEAWKEAFRAMGQRYRQHPGFRGYYLMHVCGDWGGWLDRPWRGEIVGYEPSTLTAFRAYLQKDLGLSLEQLNQRWGTQHLTWDEVAAPLPDFSKGKMPDLRPQWLDFSRFKNDLAGRWFPDLAAAVREFDQKHLIIAYGGKPKGLVGVADYLHNGGNHFLEREGSLMKAWEGGLGWITEPHHPSFWAAYGDPRADGAGGDKGAGWVLDWSTYIMMAQAGGGGANLHVYYTPNINGGLSLAAHAGGIVALDRLEKFKPILRELQTVKMSQPVKQVLVLQDPNTLYAKHRTTFRSRLEDLKRWFDLLKLDAVDYEELRDDNQANGKLILPNVFDEVMSGANIETLGKLVKNGAKMVITANTGRYSPEMGTDPFPLLRSLGISPPAGEFVLTDENVRATVVAENPLFAKPSEIHYFTLADMRRDLADPVKQKAFYSSPYRWLPETDYFGYYRDNKEVNGEVLARFASGGVALSRNKVGKGEVIVFWGTPDFRPEYLQGMMARAADWAGVVSPRKGSPVPYTMEAHSDTLGRHYALMYQITPGDYTQKLPMVPDGDFFIDEMVSDQKLGTYTGKELREKGLDVSFVKGCSPLKVVRMIPLKMMKHVPQWLDLYRQKETQEK